MTGDETDTKPAKPVKAPPMAADSLVAHLTTKASNAGKYLEQLTDRQPKQLTDDDLEAAMQAVIADPTLLGRVAELARLVQSSPSITVRARLFKWAAEIVETHFPGWKPSLAESSGSLVAQLAIRSGRKTEDLKEKQASDALLQIGLAVLVGQYSWPPRTVIAELQSGFDKSRKDAAGTTNAPSPEQLVNKLLYKATARQLHDYASIASLLNAEVQRAREMARQAAEARQEQFDRYVVAKAHGDRLAATILEKDASIASLDARIRDLEAQLASASSGAAHTQTSILARYRSFLDRQLSPKVADAAEALDGPDPFLEVAIHRVKSLKQAIEKEAAWLNAPSE